MGVPTSEDGYTPAIPRREDHEVNKGHVVALGGGTKNNILLLEIWRGGVYRVEIFSKRLFGWYKDRKKKRKTSILRDAEKNHGRFCPSPPPPPPILLAKLRLPVLGLYLSHKALPVTTGTVPFFLPVTFPVCIADHNKFLLHVAKLRQKSLQFKSVNR